MRTCTNYLKTLFAFAAITTLAAPFNVFAGGTPADGTFAGNQVHNVQGSGLATSIGDYIHASSGLNSPHDFYIEVPPGTTTMTVQIFDADLGGQGAAADTTLGLDQVSADSLDTNYALFTPTNSNQANFTVNNGGGGSAFHNVWATLAVVANPAAGHWRVQINPNTGDDINGYGVRAFVTNANNSDRELNMYYEIGVPGQESNTNRTRIFTQYPYITQGCNFSFNEFDADSNSSTVDLDLNSRSGAFSQNFPDATLSGNNVWTGHTVTGWTADDRAIDYGIWNYIFDMNSSGNGASANYVTMWAGAQGASPAPTPSSDPPSGALRIYLPADPSNPANSATAGAPVKPFVAHFLEYVSGPNPPAALALTVVQVNVVVSNPTPHAVTFSTPSRVVTAAVPGGLQSTYQGNATVTSGSIVSQPAVNATSGNIVWNPGTVAGGTTAILRYNVGVTPTVPFQRVPVTGSGGSGTTATYLDETGNAAQLRAIYTHGPLCELATTATNGDPLFIDLESFTASSAGQGSPVQLAWVTGAEVDNAGFVVYRAVLDASGVNIKGEAINSVPVPSNASNGAGASYALVDPLVLSSDAEPRSYFLEDIDLAGKRTLHGPFSLATRAALGVDSWETYR